MPGPCENEAVTFVAQVCALRRVGPLLLEDLGRVAFDPYARGGRGDQCLFGFEFAVRRIRAPLLGLLPPLRRFGRARLRVHALLR